MTCSPGVAGRRSVLALVAVAVGVLMATWAVPAALADYQVLKLTGSITAPTENQTLATARVEVKGEFGYNNPTARVSGIDLAVAGLDGQAVPGDAKAHIDGDSGKDTQPFDWTTPALTYNGRYKATAVATGNVGVGADRTATVERTFALAVPPAPPAGVKATPDAARGTVTVGWDPNPEPDLVAYGVERAGPDGAYAPLGTVDAPATSYTDSPPPGDWQYAVVAIRKGAASDQLVSSADSKPATITLAAPPTTAAGPSGAGAGSGGPSSTSSTGATGAGAASAGAARSPSVDPKSFSALLNGRRAPAAAAAAPSPAAEGADPGYNETLPFPQAGTKPAQGDEPVLGADDGTATAVVGHGSDGGSRRAGVIAVAAFLLLFVMTMQLRWILRQTALADLDALALPPTPAPPVEPPRPTASVTDSGAGPLDDGWGEPAPSYAFADPFDPAADGAEPAGPLPSMVPAVPAFAPLDAPDLDIPQPVRRRSRRRLADAG